MHGRAIARFRRVNEYPTSLQSDFPAVKVCEAGEHEYIVEKSNHCLHDDIYYRIEPTIPVETLKERAIIIGSHDENEQSTKYGGD